MILMHSSKKGNCKSVSNGMVFILGLILAFLITRAESAEVSGQITESTRWDLNHSPFELKGDVQIWNRSESAEIVELKIEPGVEVNLKGFRIIAGSIQPVKGHPYYPGRILADHVRFFGKGNVVLACGEKNNISNCLFDSVHLFLGSETKTKSSGKIQNITMNHANIIIYAGKWEIAGGKLFNGTISYKATGIPGTMSPESQYIQFFMNMISLP
jgi:hypothetical protein